MAIAAIQFALTYGVYEQELVAAISESLISTLIFALLGVGLWYMVRFSGKQIKGFVKNLVYHLASCVFTIFLWQFLTYLALRLLFSSNEHFMGFLLTSMVVKLLTGVLIYFLLISVDFLVMSFEEMQEKAVHEVALSTMLRDAELAMLRSQIRPHFLFNSLNSVSALTLSNPQAAQDMIIKLSEFMRYSIGLAAETMNSLNEELYHASLYLDIEKVRFSDRIAIEKNIDPACGEMRIPAMILQPLLENAVKHGVNTMLTSCKISLNASCSSSSLHISISNNFDPDAVPRKGTGTGLKNVQKRMAAIYGRTDLLTTKVKNNEVFEVSLIVPAPKEQ